MALLIRFTIEICHVQIGECGVELLKIIAQDTNYEINQNEK